MTRILQMAWNTWNPWVFQWILPWHRAHGHACSWLLLCCWQLFILAPWSELVPALPRIWVKIGHRHLSISMDFCHVPWKKKTAMNSERKNHDGALKPTVGSIESHELLFSHPSKKWSHVYVLYFWEAIHKQLPCLNSHHNPFQSSMVKQTFPKIILPPSTTFKIWSPKHRNMHDDMMISLDWVPEIIPSTSSNLCSLLLKLPQLIKNGSGLPLSDFSGCPQLRS